MAVRADSTVAGVCAAPGITTVSENTKHYARPGHISQSMNAIDLWKPGVGIVFAARSPSSVQWDFKITFEQNVRVTAVKVNFDAGGTIYFQDSERRTLAQRECKGPNGHGDEQCPMEISGPGANGNAFFFYATTWHSDWTFWHSLQVEYECT